VARQRFHLWWEGLGTKGMAGEQVVGAETQPKGALGSKFWTGTQLVSPAAGPEKKNWTPLEHNFKTVFTKYLEYLSIW